MISLKKMKQKIIEFISSLVYKGNVLWVCMIQKLVLWGLFVLHQVILPTRVFLWWLLKKILFRVEEQKITPRLIKVVVWLWWFLKKFKNYTVSSKTLPKRVWYLMRSPTLRFFSKWWNKLVNFLERLFKRFYLKIKRTPSEVKTLLHRKKISLKGVHLKKRVYLRNGGTKLLRLPIRWYNPPETKTIYDNEFHSLENVFPHEDEEPFEELSHEFFEEQQTDEIQDEDFDHDDDDLYGTVGSTGLLDEDLPYTEVDRFMRYHKKEGFVRKDYTHGEETLESWNPQNLINLKYSSQRLISPGDGPSVSNDPDIHEEPFNNLFGRWAQLADWHFLVTNPRRVTRANYFPQGFMHYLLFEHRRSWAGGDPTSGGDPRRWRRNARGQTRWLLKDRFSTWGWVRQHMFTSDRHNSLHDTSYGRKKIFAKFYPNGSIWYPYRSRTRYKNLFRRFVPRTNRWLSPRVYRTPSVYDFDEDIPVEPTRFVHQSIWHRQNVLHQKRARLLRPIREYFPPKKGFYKWWLHTQKIQTHRGLWGYRGELLDPRQGNRSNAGGYQWFPRLWHTSLNTGYPPPRGIQKELAENLRFQMGTQPELWGLVYPKLNKLVYPTGKTLLFGKKQFRPFPIKKRVLPWVAPSWEPSLTIRNNQNIPSSGMFPLWGVLLFSTVIPAVALYVGLTCMVWLMKEPSVYNQIETLWPTGNYTGDQWQYSKFHWEKLDPWVPWTNEPHWPTPVDGDYFRRVSIGGQSGYSLERNQVPRQRWTTKVFGWGVSRQRQTDWSYEYVSPVGEKWSDQPGLDANLMAQFYGNNILSGPTVQGGEGVGPHGQWTTTFMYGWQAWDRANYFEHRGFFTYQDIFIPAWAHADGVIGDSYVGFKNFRGMKDGIEVDTTRRLIDHRYNQQSDMLRPLWYLLTVWVMPWIYWTEWSNESETAMELVFRAWLQNPEWITPRGDFPILGKSSVDHQQTKWSISYLPYWELLSTEYMWPSEMHISRQRAIGGLGEDARYSLDRRLRTRSAGFTYLGVPTLWEPHVNRELLQKWDHQVRFLEQHNELIQKVGADPLDWWTLQSRLYLSRLWDTLLFPGWVSLRDGTQVTELLRYLFFWVALLVWVNYLFFKGESQIVVSENNGYRGISGQPQWRYNSPRIFTQKSTTNRSNKKLRLQNFTQRRKNLNFLGNRTPKGGTLLGEANRRWTYRVHLLGIPRDSRRAKIQRCGLNEEAPWKWERYWYWRTVKLGFSRQAPELSIHQGGSSSVERKKLRLYQPHSPLTLWKKSLSENNSTKKSTLRGGYPGGGVGYHLVRYPTWRASVCLGELGEPTLREYITNVPPQRGFLPHSGGTFWLVTPKGSFLQNNEDTFNDDSSQTLENWFPTTKQRIRSHTERYISPEAQRSSYRRSSIRLRGYQNKLTPKIWTTGLSNRGLLQNKKEVPNWKTTPTWFSRYIQKKYHYQRYRSSLGLLSVPLSKKGRNLQQNSRENTTFHREVLSSLGGFSCGDSLDPNQQGLSTLQGEPHWEGVGYLSDFYDEDYDDYYDGLHSDEFEEEDDYFSAGVTDEPIEMTYLTIETNSLSVGLFRSSFVYGNIYQRGNYHLLNWARLCYLGGNHYVGSGDTPSGTEGGSHQWSPLGGDHPYSSGFSLLMGYEMPRFYRRLQRWHRQSWATTFGNTPYYQNRWSSEGEGAGGVATNKFKVLPSAYPRGGEGIQVAQSNKPYFRGQDYNKLKPRKIVSKTKLLGTSELFLQGGPLWVDPICHVQDELFLLGWTVHDGTQCEEVTPNLGNALDDLDGAEFGFSFLGGHTPYRWAGLGGLLYLQQRPQTWGYSSFIGFTQNNKNKGWFPISGLNTWRYLVGENLLLLQNFHKTRGLAFWFDSEGPLFERITTEYTDGYEYDRLEEELGLIFDRDDEDYYGEGADHEEYDAEVPRARPKDYPPWLVELAIGGASPGETSPEGILIRLGQPEGLVPDDMSDLGGARPTKERIWKWVERELIRTIKQKNKITNLNKLPLESYSHSVNSTKKGFLHFLIPRKWKKKKTPYSKDLLAYYRKKERAKPQHLRVDPQEQQRKIRRLRKSLAYKDKDLAGKKGFPQNENLEVLQDFWDSSPHEGHPDAMLLGETFSLTGETTFELEDEDEDDFNESSLRLWALTELYYGDYPIGSRIDS